MGEDFFPKVEEMKSEKNSRNNSIIEKKDLKKKKKKCCNFWSNIFMIVKIFIYHLESSY